MPRRVRHKLGYDPGRSQLILIFRDLEKMTQIITQVLGGAEVGSSGDSTFSTSREEFFMAGGI
jgi:fosfomycin resistance protein FosX